LLLIAIIVPMTIAHAEIPVSIDTLEIDLWPEYDKPDMLVIYRISISPDTPIPATMTLHIPARVGDPAHVATREADGNYYNIPFTRTVSGDWSLISFTVSTREVQFEYYDPALVKNDSTRTFEYEWQGEYNVSSLTIQVQQPTGATNMEITPSLGAAISGNGGINYYQSVWGSVSQGTKVSISLQYQKNNDNLTASGLQVQPIAPISSKTAGRAPTINYVIAWTLGGLGLLLLIGGGVWYWNSARGEVSVPNRKHHRFKLQNLFWSRRTTRNNIALDGAYCHQCGNRARKGDIFCRVCGTRLRKDEAG
jgi:hypothetical protein